MKVKDHFFSKEIFEVKEVSDGILKTFPIPKNISKYYESENYISHNQNNKSIKTKIYIFFQKINFKYKKKILNLKIQNKNTILDYGCGNGYFLYYIKNKCNILGLEPNENAKKIAQQKLGKEKIINKLSDIPNLSLNIVTLWHVFEHIENQKDFLNEVYKKLAPKGKLIIAVPNYKSYDANYYKEYWAAYDVPRHIFHFSREGIKNIFSNEKWNLKKIKPLLLDSFYISIISEKYKKSYFPLVKGIIRGIISNIKAKKTGEYSSLIYVIEKNKID